MGFSSLRLLDEVQHLSQLEAFDARPFLDGIARDVAELAGGTLDDLGRELDALRDLFADIDRFAEKSMQILLAQTRLSTDPLPPQLRMLLKTTVVNYERELPLLRGRVGTALARIDRSTAGEVTDRVMEAAERVLAGRAALREGVMLLGQKLAAARLPLAQRAARDGALSAADRQRWGQARIDLEQLIARGEVLASGRFAERLARIPPPPDEPEPEPGKSRFSLLEID